MHAIKGSVQITSEYRLEANIPIVQGIREKLIQKIYD